MAKKETEEKAVAAPTRPAEVVTLVYDGGYAEAEIAQVGLVRKGEEIEVRADLVEHLVKSKGFKTK